jgi:putative flippase GtrA
MSKTNVSILGRQIGKFSIVGILNTLIDVAVLNFLVLALGFKAKIFIFGFPYLVANIISVTLAMINSFILNKYWTFESKRKEKLTSEVFKFLFITIIGMYVVHQLVFNFFDSYWLWPASQLINLFNFLGLVGLDRFISLNFAKVIAILVSLVWNFIGYRIWVFKK